MTTTTRFMTGGLRRLLSNASLFACSDPAEPSLCVIRFEHIKAREGHHLFIAATNRHVLSYEEAWPADADGFESFSLRVTDARQLLKTIPVVRSTRRCRRPCGSSRTMS